MEAQDVGFLYAGDEAGGPTNMNFFHIISGDALTIPSGLVIETATKNAIRAIISGQTKQVNVRTQEVMNILDEIAANNWTLSEFGKTYVTKFNTEDSIVDGQLVNGNHLVQYAKDQGIWGSE